MPLLLELSADLHDTSSVYYPDWDKNRHSNCRRSSRLLCNHVGPHLLT